MGVHGLWHILKPYSRQTSQEEWRGLRLAVDASIWISQFRLVAVDSKDDGDVNTRIVEGCFRRILKLLFFGIQPVFVFDGAAPELKHREQWRRRQSQAEMERKRVEARAKRILAAQLAGGRDVLAESIAAGNKLKKRGEQQASTNKTEQHDQAGDEEEDAMPTRNQKEISAKAKGKKRKSENKGFFFDLKARVERHKNVQDGNSFSTRTIDKFVKQSAVDKKNRAARDARVELAEDNELHFQSGVYLGPRQALESVEQRRLEIVAESDAAAASILARGTEDGAGGRKSSSNKTRRSTTTLGPRAVHQDGLPQQVSDSDDSETTSDEESVENFFDEEEEEEEDEMTSSTSAEELSDDSIVLICKDEVEEEGDASPSSKQQVSSSSVMIIDAAEEESVIDVDDPVCVARVKPKTNQPAARGGSDEEDDFEAVVFDTPKKRGPSLGINERASLLFATPAEKGKKRLTPAKPSDLSKEPNKPQTTVTSTTTTTTTNGSVGAGPSTTTAGQQRREQQSVSYELLGLVELLDAANIPYITAPGEADAQCAYLSAQGLVDAVLTEDSDVMVFGASRVIRGFFDPKALPTLYEAKTLKEKSGLTAASLAGLALLLGSDYTEGVHGIGKIAAVEVLSAFLPPGTDNPSIDDIFDALSKWRRAVERTGTQRPRTSGEAAKESRNSSLLEEDEETISIHQYFMRKRLALALHTKAPKSNTKQKTKTNKKTSDQDQDTEQQQAAEVALAAGDKALPVHFPSAEVLAAYSQPPIDASLAAFEFGPPDFHKLKQLGIIRCQWTPRDIVQRVDPVEKKWAASGGQDPNLVGPGGQLLLTHFFQSAKERMPKKLLRESHEEGAGDAEDLGAAPKEAAGRIQAAIKQFHLTRTTIPK